MLSTLALSFITVVDKGSFTLAAKELSLAKSAVSQNLKRLESQLGVKLANRTTRRFSLTPAGERYYQRCKEILALAKIADTEMENFGAAPAGPITVTAPHALISPLIAPAIKKIMHRYPSLKPNVIAEDKRLDLVAAGIDVSITVGKLKDSNLRARKVGVLRDVLCAAPELVSALPTEASIEAIEAIQSLPYIAHPRERMSIEHTLRSKDSENTLLLTFNPVMYSNTVESLITFAKAGMGVALLPDIAIRDELANASLVRLFPHYTMTEKPIYAVHAYDKMPPKSVFEVINAIREELEK